MNPTPVRPIRFFVVTFLLSWLIWIPLVASHFRVGPFHVAESASNIIRLFGVLMPATSALILTPQAGGREAIRSLLDRLTLWRVGLKWWLAAIVIQPLLLVIAALWLNWIKGRPVIQITDTISWGSLVVNAILLLIATLGEEIGWRGVALPALQQKYRPWKATMILGLLWASWHLPFWLLLDTFQQHGVFYLVLNFLFVLPLTFYCTWFFNHGKSSLLLAVAFHVSFNIVNTVLLPVTIHLQAYEIFIALEWILMVIIFPYLEATQRFQFPETARG